jgi:transposase
VPPQDTSRPATTPPTSTAAGRRHGAAGQRLPPPHGSFGALLRACRHQALLSQEQLAARAELSDRTVRDIEAGRVRSPRTDTVRLLADALQLTGPERESWYEAARSVNHQRAGPAAPVARGPVRPSSDAPAQLPLGASGFGMANNCRCRRLPGGEFPAATVTRCRRDDRPANRAAQDVDPIETPMRAQAGQAEPDARTSNDDGLTTAERLELAELRRENRRLREDVEILKQATAIVARLTR